MKVGETFKSSEKASVFVTDVNQLNEEEGCSQDFLAWPQDWKDSA